MGDALIETTCDNCGVYFTRYRSALNDAVRHYCSHRCSGIGLKTYHSGKNSSRWKGVDSCTIKGCSEEYHAKGYCSKHYLKIYKFNNPNYVSDKMEYHGSSKTDVYKIWKGMKQRCLNPNCKAYSYYGGRGITICDEWRKSFLAFYNYIGPRPSKKHSIDRIDNDGNYEPGNVRWATQKQQVANSRANGNDPKKEAINA